MEIQELLKIYTTHPSVVAAKALLKEEGASNVYATGLAGSASPLLIASLFEKQKGVFVCVLDDLESAGYFYNDLTQLLSEKSVFFFPSAYHRHIKYGHIDSANEILRTEVFNLLQDAQKSYVVVTYPDALAEKVVGKEQFKEQTLRINKNEQVDSLFVSDVLDAYGFEHTDYVYEPGQYAIRGSILDVFSYAGEYPYRLDFFGNEVESIRTFDVETQLSIEQLDQVFILPRVVASADTQLSILDEFPAETVFVYHDFAWSVERIRGLWEELPVVGDEESFADQEEMRSKLITTEHFFHIATNFKRIHVGAKPREAVGATVEFHTKPQPLYHKNFDLISESFTDLLNEGYQLLIMSAVEKQASRLAAIFKERGDAIQFTAVHKTLHEGFLDEHLKVCFFTDHQIFNRFHKFSLKSERARSGKLTLSIKELRQFTKGDYIVHIDHGVGQFDGLIRTEVNGNIQEAVKLIYKNGDILVVSIHALHKLSKYKGKDSETPTLNKLGTGAWEKMKNRTKKKVKDIARDLILLYSQRKKEKGFAFSKDNFMQEELEASFIYEDTPDQEKATAAVKVDMESEHPMDRLVCGDVGFGKTEIAIRAAFKAVSDNKQVAILVPTTILAFQHFQTFTERLKDFPCSIDYISRARSTKDMKSIKERLKSGQLDIIIGTHRIVSKDIEFKDLGLLIIDEEQKFGVSVKEKLRQMKVNVDTLTMTATPIPRTLQFSLMGARDLSNIATPPPNRYPVQTDVERFNADIIREAINFEMSRNGQIFFINNRIQNIYEIEALIKREVPDARIAVGHGQMDPEKLEQTILGFVNYDYDVLVATSIIENGLDVPNANTIIVNNAHQFGLAELHQLRGRVGRSNRKAFCYLLSPPLSTLPVDSRRRLQAIESFSELGSGIHIAMQDLDIRGAGNILGAEQSGFIADVGYEAYQKILVEAVDELKEEEFADLYAEAEKKEEDMKFVRETFIESDLELMFLPAYIPNDSERLSVYRELDSIENEEQLAVFGAELTDRFGQIPKEGEELINVVRLRWLGKKMGIEKITLKQGKMWLHLINNAESPYYQSRAFGKLIAYIQKNPRSCDLRDRDGKRSMIVKKVQTVEAAYRVLEEMSMLPLLGE